MSPQESYRIAIQKEGMIRDLVKNLSSDNDELQMHCASAIFKVPVFHTPAIVSERNEQRVDPACSGNNADPLFDFLVCRGPTNPCPGA